MTHEAQPLLAGSSSSSGPTDHGTLSKPRRPSNSSLPAPIFVAANDASAAGLRSPASPLVPLSPGAASSIHDHHVDRPMSWARNWREIKRLARLSAPCVSSQVLNYMNRMVVTLMVGHLGAAELASSTLAVMFSNVLGFSICFGLSTALDTLASQAVTGSANPRQAGIFLQRAILINVLLAIPISVVWIFAEPLLVLLGQEPELAYMAGNYIKLMLPGLVPNIITNCIAKFLQAQGLMDAQMLVMLAVFPINVALQYFLVYFPSPFQIGFYGAPLGSAMCDILAMIGIILYAVYWNGYQAWHPWTWEATKNWKQYLNLGFPGMVMICAEWWMFEVVALLAGLFGATALAAQSVMLNTASLVYMFALGVSVANSNRVGNFLGAGKPGRAKHSAYMSLVMALVMAAVNCVILIALRNQWGYIFTSDPDVIALVASVLPVCAVFQFADGACCVLGGILRGCGKQKQGALINLVSYYLVGLPLALLFTFPLKFELFGIWVGLALALAFTLIVTGLYVFYSIDWVDEVRCARLRVNEHTPATMSGSDVESAEVLVEDEDRLIEDSD
ncbi:hypothetical protein GGF32_000432 [Allomyces javanicus]|nr:hypothetical protein GGF32_000432 [Allomyces javanicus]